MPRTPHVYGTEYSFVGSYARLPVCLADVLVVFKAAAINLCKAAFTDHALNCIIGRNAKVIRTIIGLKLNHHFLVAGDDFFFYCYPGAAFELILQRRLKIVAPVKKVESFVRAAAGKTGTTSASIAAARSSETSFFIIFPPFLCFMLFSKITNRFNRAAAVVRKRGAVRHRDSVFLCNFPPLLFGFLLLSNAAQIYNQKQRTDNHEHQCRKRAEFCVNASLCRF